MPHWTRWLSLSSIALAIASLWGLIRGYSGLARDGELYAIQAFARLQTNLASDLYLQNVSQDRFTAFSPLYAFLIHSIGLHNAELALYAACTALFLAASFILARRLTTTEYQAALSVAFLVTVSSYYGAYQVFMYGENFLTARSAAEALVVTALALHVYGWRKCGLCVAGIALSLHPLIALPGVLLLLSLWLSWRTALIAASISVASVFCLAAAALRVPLPKPFEVMDPQWLAVVRERSQFLFLQFWTANDWENAMRPIVSLTLSALVLRDKRVRALCFGTILLALSGLAVALIAGAMGPVAILVQGQAWRWAWLAAYASAILVIPTAFEVWREPGSGPLCAVMLIIGWTFSGIDILIGVDAALLLWHVKTKIPKSMLRYLPWLAGALAATAVIVSIVKALPIASRPEANTGTASFAAALRATFGQHILALGAAASVIYWIVKSRSPARLVSTSAVLLAVAAMIFIGNLKFESPVGSAAQIEEFADWRSQIPLTSTVLTISATKSAAFTWFTLLRPSYLSVDQSAGVVFSEATAAEVRRRADVLLPIMVRDWMIRSQIAASHAGTPSPPMKTLSAEILRGICGDSLLGFVIAKEDVGLPAFKHTHVGAWQGWNLYDCRRVLASSPDA